MVLNETHCPICNYILDESAHWRTLPDLDGEHYNCPVCGRFAMSGTLISTFKSSYQDRAYLLSGYIANRTKRIVWAGGIPRVKGEMVGVEIDLHTANVNEILDSIPQLSLIEKIDKMLSWAGDICSERADLWWITGNTRETDYSLVYAKSPNEFGNLLEMALSEQFLETPKLQGNRVRPSLKGWGHIRELKRIRPDSKQAFVAMWFDVSMAGIYLEGIKPALEEMGFKPFRVDFVEHGGKIDDLIIAEIRRSGLVVADFTSEAKKPGGRGGVYYEAGFAEGLNIPVIRTCRENQIKKVHFDTRQYNHITWNDANELRRKIINRIGAMPIRPKY